MSAVFPHVDICALKKFAAAAAAGEHASRLSRNSLMGVPSSVGKKKGKGKAHDRKAPYPVVTGCEDFCHVGEQVCRSEPSPSSLGFRSITLPFVDDSDHI
jgi:hypothetical protein